MASAHLSLFAQGDDKGLKGEAAEVLVSSRPARESEEEHVGSQTAGWALNEQKAEARRSGWDSDEEDWDPKEQSRPKEHHLPVGRNSDHLSSSHKVPNLGASAHCPDIGVEQDIAPQV